MDATAWTVVAATLVILGAVATSFRSLRVEMRAQRDETRDLREQLDAQGAQLRERIDAQGEDLRNRIDTQGEDLRNRIDAQGEQLRERIDAQGKELGEQIGQLRERMAHLEGLLEGLREAITGKRAA